MGEFDRMGGEEVLRGLVEQFIHRASRDTIIGFFFAGKDLDLIALREYQLAAERLGGPVVYQGRPLDAVHRPLGINKGHLRRRLVILESVLREHGVDEAIIEAWLSEERALEPLVTTLRDCVEDG